MLTSLELTIDQLLKKGEYELDLQTPETMNLFGSTKTKEKKQKMEKTYQVYKQMKKFQSNVTQQITNINKSL